jgi:hypothetical protein
MWRADTAGVIRFHGSGKRGNPGLAAVVVDLDQAIAALARAREALVAARGAGDRRQREDLLATATERVELGRRFARDVGRRLGGKRRKRKPRAVTVTLQLRLRGV